MSSLLLGIDLGTTATKTVICDPGGVILAAADRPTALRSEAPGYAEAETAEWWGNVTALIPEVLARAGATGRDVGVVATSGMVPAVVCLGKRGPLRRAILQNDARTRVEIEDLTRVLGDLDLLSLTGSGLTQQSVAPTLLWLARHEPDTWGATESVAGSYDWLSRQLGAEAHIEYNWALESGMFAFDGSPLSPVLEAVGLAPEYFPPVKHTGDRVGAISQESSAATHLLAGTPIVVGGADHVLSAYAAGLAEPGDILVKLGGAGDILAVADERVIDPRLYLDSHPAPGLWMPNGCMATSGSLIRWVQALAGGVDLAVLDREATARPPAEVLCLPYFLGEKSPIHDPDLRGAFAGLHLGHDRGTLHRAALEGIAFGFRHHLEILREAGLAVVAARVTNGGSRSNLWKQILADVLDLSLAPVIDHPGAALGAALAAGVGAGLVPTWDAAKEGARCAAPLRPSDEASKVYDDAYATWRHLGDALAPISHSLAARPRQ